MYKIITSLFLQKSLNAYRNSEIQPNKKFLKRVPYNDQFCKTRDLKFDKPFMLRIIQSWHFLKIKLVLNSSSL